MGVAADFLFVAFVILHQGELFNKQAHRQQEKSYKYHDKRNIIYVTTREYVWLGVECEKVPMGTGGPALFLGNHCSLAPLQPKPANPWRTNKLGDESAPAGKAENAVR